MGKDGSEISEQNMDDFNREVYCLAGLPFDAVDMTGAVAKIQTAISNRKRCFLSTPNLNFLIACMNDTGFRDSVINSDLSVADGMPLIWMARLLGIPLRERVAGSSLFEELRHLGGEDGKPIAVYFFGGPEGVAEEAFNKLNEEAGGMRGVGYMCPGFGSVEDMSTPEIIDAINASNADFLVVALGARKGQEWIEHNRDRLNVPVISHLGAVVNFVAGSVNRAPQWMQRSGLEWLWRIKEESGLWKRYLYDGLALIKLFATHILPYKLFQIFNPAHIISPKLEIEEQEDSITIKIAEYSEEESGEVLVKIFSDCVDRSKDINLLFEGNACINSATIGKIILLRSAITSSGKSLKVCSRSKCASHVFKFTYSEYLLDE